MKQHLRRAARRCDVIQQHATGPGLADRGSRQCARQLRVVLPRVLECRACILERHSKIRAYAPLRAVCDSERAAGRRRALRWSQLLLLRTAHERLVKKHHLTVSICIRLCKSRTRVDSRSVHQQAPQARSPELRCCAVVQPSGATPQRCDKQCEQPRPHRLITWHCSAQGCAFTAGCQRLPLLGTRTSACGAKHARLLTGCGCETAEPRRPGNRVPGGRQHTA